MKILASGIAGLLMLAGAASAGPVEDGKGAFERGDVASAIAHYKPEAEQGNAEAQVGLGEVYHETNGPYWNDEEAARWYRMAAEQGHAKAQTKLGYLYENGYGVPESRSEALKWYEKAAEQGYAQAQVGMGDLSRDDADKVGWYRKAAEQGYVEGQFQLGEMYRYGHGVPRDINETIKRFQKAAGQGHLRAMQDLGVIYAYSEGVPEDKVVAYMWWTLAVSRGSRVLHSKLYSIENHMTRDEIVRAIRKARNWEPGPE